MARRARPRASARRHSELGAQHRTTVIELAQGRRIVKVERVWRLDRTYYERYIDDGGTVRSTDFG